MLTWRRRSSMGWWGRWSSSASSPSPSTLAASPSLGWSGGSEMRLVLDLSETFHCYHLFGCLQLLWLIRHPRWPAVQWMLIFSGVPALHRHLRPLGVQDLSLVLLILSCCQCRSCSPSSHFYDKQWGLAPLPQLVVHQMAECKPHPGNLEPHIHPDQCCSFPPPPLCLPLLWEWGVHRSKERTHVQS